MRGVNPLLLGAWRALAGSVDGNASRIGYLLLQSAALLLWWPWSGIATVLESGSPPKALSAVVIALGIAAAFDGVRAGAEESLLRGEHPLHEWLADTPLSVGRILRGWLAVQVLQVLYLLTLSTPLLMAAFTVSGASWIELGTAVAVIVPMALCYRLCGALLYRLSGYRPQASFVALRALVVVSFVLTALLLPAASHLRVAPALLLEGHTMDLAMGGMPGHLVFVYVYGGLTAVLLSVLYLLLRRYRRGLEETMVTETATHERRP